MSFFFSMVEGSDAILVCHVCILGEFAMTSSPVSRVRLLLLKMLKVLGCFGSRLKSCTCVALARTGLLVITARAL